MLKVEGGKRRKKPRRQEAEIHGCQPRRHDRHGCEADHCVVREVDEHEWKRLTARGAGPREAPSVSPSLFSEAPGRQSDFPTKARRKGRLAIEADGAGDLGKGQVGVEYELFRALDASADDVLVQPDARGALERTAEVKRAEACDLADLGQRQRLGKMRLDVLGHSPQSLARERSLLCALGSTQPLF
jgi:hypothetical protein